MRRFLVPLAALVALVVLPACDSGADAIGVTGTWEGDVFDPNVANATRYPIELRLTDTGVQVTGRGFVDGLVTDDQLPNGRLDFAVTGGSFLDGDLTLNLQFALAPFMGTITGDLVNQDPGRIRGSFAGRGEANGDLVIELTAR